MRDHDYSSGSIETGQGSPGNMPKPVQWED